MRSRSDNSAFTREPRYEEPDFCMLGVRGFVGSFQRDGPDIRRLHASVPRRWWPITRPPRWSATARWLRRHTIRRQPLTRRTMPPRRRTTRPRRWRRLTMWRRYTPMAGQSLCGRRSTWPASRCGTCCERSRRRSFLPERTKSPRAYALPNLVPTLCVGTRWTAALRRGGRGASAPCVTTRSIVTTVAARPESRVELGPRSSSPAVPSPCAARATPDR